MATYGSQGSVRRCVIDEVNAVVKKVKYDQMCLALEAHVLQEIHSKCPDVACHFPKFIKLGKGKLFMSLIDGEELTSVIPRIYKRFQSQAVHQIMNICFIALCALEHVRRKTGIVHNDLHASNIMVVKTEKESLTFVFDDKPYTFKTYGYFPMIIDFGYAHIEGNIMASLQHTDIGYTIEEQDLLADARTILYSAFSKQDGIEYVKTVFSPLPLSKEGWFPKTMFTNVHDELYNLANIRRDRAMDAVLNVVVNITDNVRDDTPVATCCDHCYFLDEPENIVFSDDEEEFSDEEYSDDEGEYSEEEDDEFDEFDEPPICACHAKLCEAFDDLHAIRKSSNRLKYGQLYKAAAKAFRPFIVRALAHNRAIKRKVYGEMSVSNTLDVINKMKSLVREKM